MQIIFVNPLQSFIAEESIFVIVDGRLRDFKVRHPLQRLEGIISIPSGIINSFKALQLAKTDVPKVVTPSGIAKDVRLQQL